MKHTPDGVGETFRLKSASTWRHDADSGVEMSDIHYLPSSYVCWQKTLQLGKTDTKALLRCGRLAKNNPRVMNKSEPLRNGELRDNDPNRRPNVWIRDWLLARGHRALKCASNVELGENVVPVIWHFHVGTLHQLNVLYDEVLALWGLVGKSTSGLIYPNTESNGVLEQRKWFGSTLNPCDMGHLWPDGSYERIY